jgi:tRNA threonylcarbamoyladenosine biosynthesis protein TsaB
MNKPLLLHINTALNDAYVGISQGDAILGTASNDSPFDHASFLQPAIKQLCEDKQISLAQIDAVTVVNGPGSYTGLRVGLSAAKGICYAMNKPLICINSLEWLAKNICDSTFDLICPMIDARRMEVYTAAYDRALNCILEPTTLVLNEESFQDLLSNHAIAFIGNGSIKWKSIVHHSNAIFPASYSGIGEQKNLSLYKWESQQFDNLADAEPFYIKDFYSPMLYTKKE